MSVAFLNVCEAMARTTESEFFTRWFSSRIINSRCCSAAKYGALSMPEGCVHLHWRTTDDHVLIEWREEGGPVPVEGTSGFGTTMMRRVLSQEFDHFELEMQPTGAVCSIRIKRP